MRTLCKTVGYTEDRKLQILIVFIAIIAGVGSLILGRRLCFITLVR